MIIASFVIAAVAIATSIASAYYAWQARRATAETARIRDGRLPGPLPPSIRFEMPELPPAVLDEMRRQLAKALGLSGRAPH